MALKKKPLSDKTQPEEVIKIDITPTETEYSVEDLKEKYNVADEIIQIIDTQKPSPIVKGNASLSKGKDSVEFAFEGIIIHFKTVVQCLTNIRKTAPQKGLLNGVGKTKELAIENCKTEILTYLRKELEGTTEIFDYLEAEGKL